MALQQITHGQGTASYQYLLRALIVIGAVIVLMLVATAILGFQGTGPSFELTPDPAGLALPF